MCAARESNSLSHLKLDHPDEFYYLNQGQAPDIDGVDDMKEFKITQDAFNLLGFSEKARLVGFA